jgi:hypothetical protein
MQRGDVCFYYIKNACGRLNLQFNDTQLFLNPENPSFLAEYLEFSTD